MSCRSSKRGSVASLSAEALVLTADATAVSFARVIRVVSAPRFVLKVDSDTSWLLEERSVSSEQLLSRPTLAPEVASLITRNFVLHPTAQPSKNSIPDIETKRGADTTADDTLANDTAVALPGLDLQSNTNASADKDATLMEAPLFDDLQDMALGGDLLNMQDDEQVTKVIPKLPNLEGANVPPNHDQTTEEHESGEAWQ